MAEEMHLMIDATILKNAAMKTPARSGIFFTVLALARAFSKRSDVKLYFSCKTSFIGQLKKAIRQELTEFKKIPIIPYEDNLYFFKYISYLQTLSPSFYKTYLWIRFLLRKIKSDFYLNKNLTPSVDVFFSPCHVIQTNIGRIQNILIYDTIPFIFPKYFEDIQNGTSWFLDLANYMKTNRNTHYFSISEQTKKDFLKYVSQLRPEQITVTPLACHETFHPCSTEETLKSLKKYNLPTDKKYVFSLCSLDPRKNLIRAVKTFVEFIKKNNIDDMVFILGGGHWQDFIEKLNTEIKNLGDYKEKIIKAGYIDDEDLAPLYSGAEWFVYTSQYEGFGLPPLEAMACGCPVITSNNSSLPEVVGNAGIMIDWNSDEQHVKAYEDYYFHPELREQNRQKGLARSKEFSWDKTVDLMIKEMIK